MSSWTWWCHCFVTSFCHTHFKCQTGCTCFFNRGKREASHAVKLCYQFPEGKSISYIPQQVSDNLAGLESTGKDTTYEALAPGNVDLKEVILQEFPRHWRNLASATQNIQNQIAGTHGLWEYVLNPPPPPLQVLWPRNHATKWQSK